MKESILKERLSSIVKEKEDCVDKYKQVSNIQKQLEVRLIELESLEKEYNSLISEFDNITDIPQSEDK